MQINRFKTKEEASAAAGEALNKLLSDTQKTPVLLLLSGGSSLSILDYVNSQEISESIAITMLDERFSQEAGVNNFLQFQKQDFYSRALEAGANFIGTLPRQGENINDMRARLEISLRGWQKNNPTGKILAVFGMGTDGHTAGIFPFPEDPKMFEEMFNGNNLAAAYNAGNKNPYPERVTTTIAFFKWIDFGFGFVCGPEKKPKLDAVVANSGKVNELPALAWNEVKNFKIFTDIY